MSAALHAAEKSARIARDWPSRLFFHRAVLHVRWDDRGFQPVRKSKESESRWVPQVREANLGLFVSFWRIAHPLSHLGRARLQPCRQARLARGALPLRDGVQLIRESIFAQMPRFFRSVFSRRGIGN
jgi:hypothetical protein